MSQEKISRLGADQRTNLVAYLDGELDETAAQQVEQVLSNSPVARHEVEMLARTWDMLNVLPTQRATSEFSQHTMQKLQQADQKPPPLTERAWYKPLRRSVILAVWIIGLAGAVALGYQITSEWIPNDTVEAAKNLPVVQNLDAYQTVGKIEFLRQLRDDTQTRDKLRARANLLRVRASSTAEKK